MTSVPDRMTWEQAKESVAAGIDLLNQRGPEGWPQRIKLDKLELHQGMTCVLGQLYGDERMGYVSGVQALKLTGPEQEHYGFRTDSFYDRLQVEWHRRIAELQGYPNPVTAPGALVRWSEHAGVWRVLGAEGETVRLRSADPEAGGWMRRLGVKEAEAAVSELWLYEGDEDLL